MALAFDLDGPTGDAMLSGAIWNRPEYFTLGGYGPWRGLDRILRLLESHGIRATFFTPAWVVENWPDACRRLVAAGHEIAHHGYRHEKFWDLSLDRQRDVIELSQDIFQRELGTRAVGFRTPSGDWRVQTPALLVELGFEYSSSLRGDDRPYFHADALAGWEPLVEIPARSEMDDYASLAFTTDPNWPSGGDRIASYDLTLDNWRREFDGYHDEGLCLTTIFHPKVVGTPGRVALLDRLITHMKAPGDVWFATCQSVSSWWRTNQGVTTGESTS